MFESAFNLDIWNRFVREGVLDSSRLNQRIVESWYRSRNAHVNPHLDKGRSILNDDLLRCQMAKNALLQDIALPHLQRMNSFANDLGMIALLIDPEGYVLSISGNKDVQMAASKMNFVEGVRWTEGEVGTNAIGTALSTEEPIMVTGTEHYSVASHRWSCSAAPIRHDDGKLIGILDVSCPVDRAHPYMLGMVTSVAYSIEREISIRHHKDEMELIQRSMDIIETDRPVVICNNKQVVVCASKPIRHNMPGWIGSKPHDFMEYGYALQMEIPIYSNVHNGIIGSAVHFIETKIKPAPLCFISQVPSTPFEFKGEKGISQAFQRTLDEMKRVAPSDTSVYISGETGTGKEVIARTIHENSSRKNGPFVAVNCGAIPKDLMESELFGYAEGAFTGARRHGYKGKFEQANQGTLFLDEIGEIPHSMQVALLRVLQERKVVPLGNAKEIPVDIRIITATHRDLGQLVKDGKFREDLYYRLHVYPIDVPPLRERKEDIPYLVRYFCGKHQWNIPLHPALFERLLEYHWPGNIRELINVLERLHIVSQGEEIAPLETMHVLDRLNIRGALSSNPSLEQNNTHIPANEPAPCKPCSLRDQIQKEQMTEALQKTKGNVTMAAQLLGIPRSTFYKRLRKFNI
ncbi:sigma-54-dependent Fis family transcriptional regulator [Paenibacillus naphthalenovorans]|uniref:sigma-54-dependent Fis family transcriptional regulator n=1 Tax=Paenibacillus naphthalenovorans TaxID=162209 RepID=UPI003D2DE5EE